MSNIGMMDGAFFVGRKEILDWINTTLDLNLSKIEETASGAVACQLLDIMHPGQVPMHKVNWGAKQSFEFVGNYKILQTCFTKLNIERHVDVDRLISARYMDNLEFMQWFKRFFEMSVSDTGDYDAYTQRCKGKGGAQYGGGKKVHNKKPASAPSSKVGSTKSTSDGAKRPVAAAAVRKEKETNQENAAPKDLNRGNSNVTQEVATLKAANEEAARNYAELRVEMEGLEKERDFYFVKLRDIEVMLQELEDKGQGTELSASIFKILYATADGFEPASGATEGNATNTLEVEPDAIAGTDDGQTF